MSIASKKMNTEQPEHEEKFVSTAMRLRMEGFQEGFQEGRAEKRSEIAQNLKQLGVNNADISKVTGLSVAEIENLVN